MKINFSQGGQGKFTRSGAIKEIQVQSEIELGRSLTLDEATKLFRKFSPSLVIDRIKEVCPTIKFALETNDFLLVWIWISPIPFASQQ